MQSVACAHILVKFNGSRNPKSWRDPTGERIMNTTLEQAEAQVSKIREGIVAGTLDFFDVATEISDCGSAKNGGRLGHFTRGQMQKAFEDASFALNPGQISELVVTDSGVHIILRYE
jgi:NIMA-interacting peptidyl-prolyl cis-trans isomerase 1